MRYYCIIFLFATTSNILGQVDTLFFGQFKYPLQRTKQFYEVTSSEVKLPSEYRLNKKEQRLWYNCYCPLFKTIELNDNGETIITSAQRWKRDTCFGSWLHLYDFLDSVVYRNDEPIYPYIKRANKKHYFCAVTVLALSNDTLYRVVQNTETSDLGIDFNIDKNSMVSSTPFNKNTIFILTDLYYRRGNVTYYLDCSIQVRRK